MLVIAFKLLRMGSKVDGALPVLAQPVPDSSVSESLFR